jgi:hypothetical protein
MGFAMEFIFAEEDEQSALATLVDTLRSGSGST